MKITEQVYALDSTRMASRVYLIVGKESTLVDTGVPGQGKAILKELETLGIKPEMIKHILLTHNDLDHIGNAAFLQQKTGADVWAPQVDIPYILGEKDRPGIKKYLGWFLKATVPQNIKAFPVNNQWNEFVVIPSPGHTPGHVCLLYGDVLFAGDLVENRGGQLKPLGGLMTWNFDLLKESIQKTAQYSFNWICPAHGDPIKSRSLS